MGRWVIFVGREEGKGVGRNLRIAKCMCIGSTSTQERSEAGLKRKGDFDRGRAFLPWLRPPALACVAQDMPRSLIFIAVVILSATCGSCESLSSEKCAVNEQASNYYRSTTCPKIVALTKPRMPSVCRVVPDIGIGTFPFSAYNPGQNEKRDHIVNATKHAWDSYVKYAWGRDELMPLSKRGKDTFYGVALTILDSLDTLYIMGLEEEYKQARNYVIYGFQPEQVGAVSVFETTIRLLGGLMSMYHLSGDEEFLDAAEDLGIRLGVSFISYLGYPFPNCVLSAPICVLNPISPDNTVLAEVGTLQLEFRALGYHARTPEAQDLKRRSEYVIELLQKSAGSDAPGLLPTKLNIRTGEFVTNTKSFSAPADSYYEYIVKMWIQGGRKEEKYVKIFLSWMKDLEELLLPLGRSEYFVQMLVGDKIVARMNHFVCFLPGTIYLGIDLAENNKKRDAWKKMAEGITETCYNIYTRTKTGLSGDEIRYMGGGVRVTGGHHLRPEVLEGIFYMWKWTKNEKYRDWAWEIFLKTESVCRLDSGYAPISDVQKKSPQHIDIMHSFFISETLKYLYLIFSDDDPLPLDKYVFNTEAHPLLITPELQEA